METPVESELVRAAQAGDEHALALLLRRHLPLVYNVAGRALGTDADVDDVVQESMLRAVQSLSTLREPERFGSWLVAITIRQVQERTRVRSRRSARESPLEQVGERADPRLDFVGATILELGLSGERREVTEATRWLPGGDRPLLGVWWQEVAGVISRRELAEAVGISQEHAGVRVQRMKARLEVARVVLRTLHGRHRCPRLERLLHGVDGDPEPARLPRLTRHVRHCELCQGLARQLLPPEKLLSGMALVPISAGLLHRLPELLAGAASTGQSGLPGALTTGTGPPPADAVPLTGLPPADPLPLTGLPPADPLPLTGLPPADPLPLTGLPPADPVSLSAPSALSSPQALALKPALLAGSALTVAALALGLAVQYLPANLPPGRDAPPSRPAPSAPAAAPTAAPAATPAAVASSTATAGTATVGTVTARSTATTGSAGAAQWAGVATADLFVAPGGDDRGTGRIDDPLASLAKAVAVVRPGQTIAVRGGRHRLAGPVVVGVDGTPSQRIVLSNYRDEVPVLDARAVPPGEPAITHRGAHWTVQGLELTRAPGDAYRCVSCRGGTFRRLSVHDNQGTAFVLTGDGTVGNRVLESDFFGNHDDRRDGADADGLVLAEGSGAGNIVRGCRFYHNADDGLDIEKWDDPVTVDSSWAYGNGVNRWGLPRFAGSGYGFRLGAGRSPVAHVVTNNAAWDNIGFGFTEATNTGRMLVTGNTAFQNVRGGFSFLRSATVLARNLSLDNVGLQVEAGSGAGSGNSWDAGGSTAALVRSTDPTGALAPRRPGGALPRTSFLTTRDGVDYGASMTDPR